MPINGRRVTLVALMFGAALCTQAVSPALSLADDPVCPVGMYWNPAVVQCLPYGVNPVLGPAGPVGVGGVGPVGPGPVGPGPVGPGPVGPGPAGPGGLGPR